MSGIIPTSEPSRRPPTSDPPGSRRLARFVLLPTLGFLVLTFVAARLAEIPIQQWARAMPSYFLMLTGLFALGNPVVVSRLSALTRRSRIGPLILTQTVLLPYLVYALPLGNFSAYGFLKLAVYVNLPVLFLLSTSAWNSPLPKLGAALMVWIPIELRWLEPIWPWPPGQSGYYLYGILAAILVVTIFGVSWPLPGLGYTFSLSGRDLKLAGLGFLAFAPPAILFGILTGFLRPVERVPSLFMAVARLLGLFLATGIPEELLFRGLIQNLLQIWTRRPRLGWLMASLIFGAAHLNFGGVSDWRFVLLATVAGLVYGHLYRRSGGLLAPAIAHSVVDACWLTFFRR